jgi:Zn-dependent protease/CBS domain-containing protein
MLATFVMTNAATPSERTRNDPDVFVPPPGARPRRGILGDSGFRLGRIAGIELRVDWSLSIIFMLIVLDLGLGVFPAWHPEWSRATSWAVALGAAVLFFASILAHELSHALVAKGRGLSVPRITLFLFGGMAEMEREPGSPSTEALIAIVGPLTSLAIGIASLASVGFVMNSNEIMRLDAGAIEASSWIASLGPLTTLLLWLGPINISLALFNLVPGFPLDGGRLLRALLWWTTKDLAKATRWAAYVGRTFGWALMIMGVLSMFRGGLSQGLWLVLIGWFLSNAAQMSIRQQVLTRALAGLSVARVMRTSFERVPPEMTIEELASRVLRGELEQHAFPVERDGVLVGLVSLRDLRKVPEVEWSARTVGEIMTPAERLTTLHADVSAERAAEELARHEVDNIPVVAEDESHALRLLGMVRRADILRWVYLSSQPA